MENREILEIEAFEKKGKRSPWSEGNPLVLCEYNSRLEKHMYRLAVQMGLGSLAFRYSLKGYGQDISSYRLLFCHEFGRWPLPFIAFLRKENPSARIVYCFWNSLRMETRSRAWRKRMEVFFKARGKYDFLITSFDKNDCEKYGFYYRPQYIPRADFIRHLPADQVRDVFFAGFDKGRLGQLLALKKDFSDLGISAEFLIMPDRHGKYSEEERSHLIFKGKDWWHYRIPYDELLDETARSRAVLDIVQEGQSGLTWRPIEALQLERKLITNFRQIREYDFYCKENIFLLGEDDLIDLPEFLQSPYKRIDEKIKNRYTFRGMLCELCETEKWESIMLY